jgi:hypothetical protein
MMPRTMGWLLAASLGAGCNFERASGAPDAMPNALTLTCDARYTSLCANLDTATESAPIAQPAELACCAG